MDIDDDNDTDLKDENTAQLDDCFTKISGYISVFRRTKQKIYF